MTTHARLPVIRQPSVCASLRRGGDGERDVVLLESLTHCCRLHEQRIRVRDGLWKRELHVGVLAHHRGARRLPNSGERVLQCRRPTQHVLWIDSTATAATTTAAATTATTVSRWRVERHAEFLANRFVFLVERFELRLHVRRNGRVAGDFRCGVGHLWMERIQCRRNRDTAALQRVQIVDDDVVPLGFTRRELHVRIGNDLERFRVQHFGAGHQRHGVVARSDKRRGTTDAPATSTEPTTAATSATGLYNAAAVWRNDARILWEISRGRNRHRNTRNSGCSTTAAGTASSAGPTTTSTAPTTSCRIGGRSWDWLTAHVPTHRLDTRAVLPGGHIQHANGFAEWIGNADLEVCRRLLELVLDYRVVGRILADE